MVEHVTFVVFLFLSTILDLVYSKGLQFLIYSENICFHFFVLCEAVLISPFWVVMSHYIYQVFVTFFVQLLVHSSRSQCSA